MNTLRQLLGTLPPNFEQLQPDVMRRTRATLQFLDDRLNDLHAEIVADSTLSNMHSWVQGLVNEFQNAINSQNPGLLSNGNALSQLEAISQNLQALPVGGQSSEPMNLLLEEAQRRATTLQSIQLQQEEALRSTRDQQARLLSEAQDVKEQGLQRLREQEQAASKLLAALGAQGTSSGYRSTAEAEKKDADFWRWLTLGFGIAAVVLAVLLLKDVTGEGLRPILSRLGLSLPLVLLTLYAGRQSAEHRREQREARRLELSFGSVDAYLADLADDRRAELKAQLSSNLFSGTTAVSPEVVAGYPSASDLVGLLQEAVKKLR